jgi:hypothetical protein
MTALAAELARHVDSTGTTHRLLLVAPTKLRCLVCCQIIDLRPALSGVPGSTSTSQDPTADEQCPHHIGEWAGRCGRCRAEHLEARTPRPVQQPTFDTSDQARAKRRRLYEQSRGRTDTAESPAQHEERMAQARAELAARQPVPTPDEVTT